MCWSQRHVSESGAQHGVQCHSTRSKLFWNGCTIGGTRKIHQIRKICYLSHFEIIFIYVVSFFFWGDIDTDNQVPSITVIFCLHLCCFPFVFDFDLPGRQIRIYMITFARWTSKFDVNQKLGIAFEHHKNDVTQELPEPHSKGMNGAQTKSRKT